MALEDVMYRYLLMRGLKPMHLPLPHCDYHYMAKPEGDRVPLLVNQFEILSPHLCGSHFQTDPLGNREPDMTHERLVKDSVNRRAVEITTSWQAPQSS